MPLLGSLNSFTVDTTIDQDEVNENFTDIRTWANTYAIMTDVAKTITAQHTFSPGSAQAPFVLGANAQDQVVTGLRAGSAAALVETSGPTKLTVGAVADGQALVRSGSTLVGGSAGLTMADIEILA